MQTQRLNVPVPGIGISCDIHARFDASGPAWLGVYDRDTHRWYTSADPMMTSALLPWQTANALTALQAVRS